MEFLINFLDFQVYMVIWINMKFGLISYSLIVIKVYFKNKHY
jgi:hypothetical protein